MAARRKPGQLVFAFAAESGSDPEIVERATRKMTKKGVNALAANPVRPGLGPEAESNEFWVLKPGQEPVHLGPARKHELARPLLEALFSSPQA
jgi:phosphopantothenoylcysteine synthetase/decarboxylase